MPNTRQEILVRCTGGDNVTNTIRGERASATSSPADAALKLAKKLFGPSFVSLVHDGRTEQHVDRYVALADDTMWASCTPEGRIQFDWGIPPVNVGLAHGPRRALIEVMRQCALEVSAPPPNDPRELPHLQVPFFEQVKTREDADRVIHAFLTVNSGRNNRKGSLGVLLATTVVRCPL